jgi:hypothetical protein
VVKRQSVLYYGLCYLIKDYYQAGDHGKLSVFIMLET